MQRDPLLGTTQPGQKHPHEYCGGECRCPMCRGEACVDSLCKGEYCGLPYRVFVPSDAKQEPERNPHYRAMLEADGANPDDPTTWPRLAMEGIQVPGYESWAALHHEGGERRVQFTVNKPFGEETTHAQAWGIPQESALALLDAGIDKVSVLFREFSNRRPVIREWTLGVREFIEKSEPFDKLYVLGYEHVLLIRDAWKSR